MRKQDIRPGVVYAIWSRNSDYDTPEPIAFLAAPASGALYESPRRYPSNSVGDRAFVKSTETRPRRGYGYSGGAAGYPAVKFTADAPKDARPGDLLKTTLADFEAATSTHLGNGIMLTLITSLGQIAGPWDEIQAEYEAREQIKREQAAKERRQRDELARRAMAALDALGVPARWDGYNEQVIMSLDSAEKLAALLNPEAGE